MNFIGEDGMPIQVLLVEDSPGDVRLTQEAFRDANKAIQLNVVVDGVEAMAFLRHEGVHVHAPRPDLILLDLNLPKMDGREVLAHIKEDAMPRRGGAGLEPRVRGNIPTHHRVIVEDGVDQRAEHAVRAAV